MRSQQALKAIAEPRRQAILKLIRDRELPAGEIASRFEVTQPAISQHLRVLKESRLVTERREGTRRFYRADIETLEELREFLGWMWDQGLSNLKRVVEEDGP